MLRYSRNARRCAKNGRRYVRSSAKSEKRYTRREGRNSNSSNSNKHYCLLHHHQFHPRTSTESS
jgi:hypothetical protein